MPIRHTFTTGTYTDKARQCMFIALLVFHDAYRDLETKRSSKVMTFFSDYMRIPQRVKWKDFSAFDGEVTFPFEAYANENDEKTMREWLSQHSGREMLACAFDTALKYAEKVAKKCGLKLGEDVGTLLIRENVKKLYLKWMRMSDDYDSIRAGKKICSCGLTTSDFVFYRDLFAGEDVVNKYGAEKCDEMVGAPLNTIQLAAKSDYETNKKKLIAAFKEAEQIASEEYDNELAAFMKKLNVKYSAQTKVRKDALEADLAKLDEDYAEFGF